MTWLTWVAAHPDGERIFVGDDSGRLRIWAPAEGRVVARHEIGDRVRRAEWTGDGQRLVVIGSGDDLFVYSGDGSQLEATIPTGHTGVFGLSLHPSRPLAATTGDDGHVRVWDLTTQKVVLEVEGPSQGSETAISETHLAAGFRSGVVAVWDLDTGKKLAGRELFAAYVSALAFSRDGRSLVAGGGKGSLVELLTATWEVGEVWEGTPPKPIATNAIQCDPKGRFLCAHSDDTASLFASTHDRAPGSLGLAFYVDRKPWEQDYIVSAACFVPKTKLIITSHFTGRLRIWKENGRLKSKIAEVTFADDDTPSLLDSEATDPAAWWAQAKGPPKASAAARALDEVDWTCAACGTLARHRGPSMFHRSPRVDYWSSGLDGRPSFGDTDLATDAVLLAREFELVECPHCKHVAPRVEVPYPRAADSQAERDDMFTLPEHDDLARRYLYVAQLFGDEDPREEGLWALRAAWADEAAGFAERGRRIRRRAAALLEEALFCGYALNAVRGASSVILADLLRIAGDFAHAAQHCRRGLRMTVDANEQLFLLFEAQCILDERVEPLTRKSARERIEPLTPEQRKMIAQALERAYPLLPPVRMRVYRRFFVSAAGLPSSEEATTFTQDFLEADTLLDLLRHHRDLSWKGVLAHPELLPALLRAIDHEDEPVRRSAIFTLHGKTLSNAERTVHGTPFEPGALSKHADVALALAHRLADDDAETVRLVGAIARQVLLLEASFGQRLASAARAALPKWTSDLSTTGVLERLIEAAPKPEGRALADVSSDPRPAVTPLQTRIEAAAAITDHSVAPMLSHLEDVVPNVKDVEVATNADATAIGVSVTLIADAHLEQRLKNLANAISGSQALQRSAALRGSKVMRVERGIGPRGRPTRGLAGVFSTVYHLEPRTVADDLALAREVGIPAGVADELTTRVGQLAMTASTFRATVYTGPPDENMQIELGAPAPVDVLDRLGYADESTRFLRALEPRGKALVWVGATQKGMLPWARLEYLDPPELDEAIAIAGKFGDMDRVRRFIAALETRPGASVSVTLGTGCPLGPVWLALNVERA